MRTRSKLELIFTYRNAMNFETTFLGNCIATSGTGIGTHHDTAFERTPGQGRSRFLCFWRLNHLHNDEFSATASVI